MTRKVNELTVDAGLINEVYAIFTSHGYSQKQTSKILDDLYGRGIVFRQRKVIGV